MATIEHKRTPRQIARDVIRSNPDFLNRELSDDEVAEAAFIDAIMLGIAAYTDASNQRPENLSEACRRLGINLHWMDQRNLPNADRYAVFFGLSVPYATHTLEWAVIEELETLAPIAEKSGVNLYVKAGY